jgi:hypothetical protein
MSLEILAACGFRVRRRQSTPTALAKTRMFEGSDCEVPFVSRQRVLHRCWEMSRLTAIALGGDRRMEQRCSAMPLMSTFTRR